MYGGQFLKSFDFVMCTSVYKATKPTFLETRVQNWPVVQKKKFNCIFRKKSSKIGPREKQWQEPSSYSEFLECPQQFLRAATQSALYSESLLWLQPRDANPLAGLCGICPGEVCMRTEPSVPMTLNADNPLVGPWKYTTIIQIFLQKIAKMYQRYPEYTSTL